MKLFDYLQAVRGARTDLDIAKGIIEELDAGVSIPSVNFEPHGRNGSVSDRTANDAIHRIRRRKYATKNLRGALSTLNEFKAILMRADINETAQAALWMRWGMKMAYKDIGAQLSMSTCQAISLIHEAEECVKPLVERL